MSINSALNKLGNAIVKDARNNAKPNKKTGRLERSISYSVITSNDESKVIISEESYGQILNNKTKFMTKAVDKNIDNGAQDIAQAVADDIITKLKNI